MSEMGNSWVMKACIGGAAAQAFALRQTVEGKEALRHDGEPEKLRDAKTPAGGGSLARCVLDFTVGGKMP